MGEACVIDIPAAHRSDRDYLITVNDLAEWERTNGPFHQVCCKNNNAHVHQDCIVIVRTGYGKYWGDINKYMGCVGDEDPMHLNAAGWPDNMHWPGGY
jgi:kynurenine formamidase